MTEISQLQLKFKNKNIMTTIKNFSIKNVKYFTGHEGNGLNCTIYVNGVRTCSYVDDASGGGGWINRYFNKEKAAILDKFIADHKPVEHFNQITKKTFTYKYHIDVMVDELLKTWAEESNDRKRNKFEEEKQNLMKTAVVIMKKNDANSYRYIQYRRPFTAMTPESRKTIAERSKLILKKNEYILNTNIV